MHDEICWSTLLIVIVFILCLPLLAAPAGLCSEGISVSSVFSTVSDDVGGWTVVVLSAK